MRKGAEQDEESSPLLNGSQNGAEFGDQTGPSQGSYHCIVLIPVYWGF